MIDYIKDNLLIIGLFLILIVYIVQNELRKRGVEKKMTQKIKIYKKEKDLSLTEKKRLILLEQKELQNEVNRTRRRLAELLQKAKINNMTYKHLQKLEDLR